MKCEMVRKFKHNRSFLSKIFSEEKQFISNLFEIIGIPSHDQDDTNDCVYIKEDKPNREEARKIQRAKSFKELNEKLNKLKETKDFSLKNKLMKKSLCRRIKKKNRKEERALRKKMVKLKKQKDKVVTKTESNSETEPNVPAKPVKPVFNSQGKMVFSKFDFTESGIPEEKRKGEKDPKKILESLKKQKDDIKQLKEVGENEKATNLTEKITWKNALAKATGQKVKDDVLLLKKTVIKKEQKKRQSAKKWEQRLKTVEKTKKDKQNKRESNILKRKQEKKKKIVKKAVKKGRMIV